MGCPFPLFLRLFFLLQLLVEQPHPFRLVGGNRIFIAEIQVITQPFLIFG